MNKKEIENIVSVLLEQYGYDEEKDDYLDIVAFTRSLGFNVINAEQPEEDGFIVIRPDPTQDVIFCERKEWIGIEERSSA